MVVSRLSWKGGTGNRKTWSPRQNVRGSPLMLLALASCHVQDSKTSYKGNWGRGFFLTVDSGEKTWGVSGGRGL